MGSIVFRKLSNTGLKECVIRELEHKILSGELQPGLRLPPERELAAAMGISRSLVNLCILELESRGFVRIVPRQGTFVNDYKKQGTPQMLLSLMHYDSDRLDRTLFDNMMDTRLLLESECTRLAVKNATEEDLDAMREALGAMEAAEGGDGFIEGNFLFHRALTAASGNAVYAMIYNSFEHAIRYFLRLFFTSAERRRESAACHKALLMALRERDLERASAEIRRTLDMGISGLAGIYKRR
jgi:GntR family transcriptional repressor for pyruvate dehydrogenase complex